MDSNKKLQQIIVWLDELETKQITVIKVLAQLELDRHLLWTKEELEQ